MSPPLHAQVQVGIPRPSRDLAEQADKSAEEVAATLEGASPEDQAIFSADSVEGKVRAWGVPSWDPHAIQTHFRLKSGLCC